MNELLKRGGIEFLAVFLGIALSLWVDQYQKSKEAKKMPTRHQRSPMMVSQALRKGKEKYLGSIPSI